MQNIHEVVNRDGTVLRSPDLFHPGIILKEEIEAREITEKDFAALMNILPTHLSEVFAGRRSVGLKLARRLESALDISAGFWLRMQSDYDLKVAEQEPDLVLQKIEDILAIQQRGSVSLAKAILAYEANHMEDRWPAVHKNLVAKTRPHLTAGSKIVAAAKSGEGRPLKERNKEKKG